MLIKRGDLQPIVEIYKPEDITDESIKEAVDNTLKAIEDKVKDSKAKKEKN